MLDNTVQIVCGAGGGIGEETAVAMAKHGATVVVNDLGVDVSGEGTDTKPAQETVDRIEATGGEAIAHYGDVTELDYTETLVANTIEKFGAVHGIINYAGILRDSMVFNMDEDEWDAVINVHLKGHFSIVRAVSAHWRARFKSEDGFDRQRSLTCVSSGVTAGNPGQANYSAAKAGILGLMRTSARELHQYDVRTNALWPTALTRMTEDLPAMVGVEKETMGPQLVSGAPVFLASESARDVNGITLAIAGGNLAIVSDPGREQYLSKNVGTEGGWTATEIDEHWEKLTEGIETMRMSPGY
ncbi:SDR family NAD(P)-dependent oxidoreductase [Halococcus sp. IIIV-5B]|uniref:SDR family NAD(P)-dependent oxidoreductase n=1 Tax=Halococcus sp. IIIV-5B TaxID=2321230 RepID=UPI000E737129|nr:SDR family NAD(P)-dependent oxidoreductase [Halococcus sp. IIIV-5B]RJT07970.1 SDR family oxidoreductase [Halococcus sp. IIIV-5B]